MRSLCDFESFVIYSDVLNKEVEHLSENFEIYRFLLHKSSENLAREHNFVAIRITLQQTVFSNIVISLSKVFEKSTPYNPYNINIRKYLNGIKDNLDEINARIKDKYSNDMLKIRKKDLKKDIDKLSELELDIEKLKIYRNKVLAHLDEEYIISGDFGSEITYYRMNLLFEYFIEVIPKYSTLIGEYIINKSNETESKREIKNLMSSFN